MWLHNSHAGGSSGDGDGGGGNPASVVPSKLLPKLCSVLLERLSSETVDRLCRLHSNKPRKAARCPAFKLWDLMWHSQDTEIHHALESMSTMFELTQVTEVLQGQQGGQASLEHRLAPLLKLAACRLQLTPTTHAVAMRVASYLLYELGGTPATATVGAQLMATSPLLKACVDNITPALKPGFRGCWTVVANSLSSLQNTTHLLSCAERPQASKLHEAVRCMGVRSAVVPLLLRLAVITLATTSVPGSSPSARRPGSVAEETLERYGVDMDAMIGQCNAILNNMGPDSTTLASQLTPSSNHAPRGQPETRGHACSNSGGALVAPSAGNGAADVGVGRPATAVPAATTSAGTGLIAGAAPLPAAKVAAIAGRAGEGGSGSGVGGARAVVSSRSRPQVGGFGTQGWAMRSIKHPVTGVDIPCILISDSEEEKEEEGEGGRGVCASEGDGDGGGVHTRATAEEMQQVSHRSPTCPPKTRPTSAHQKRASTEDGHKAHDEPPHKKPKVQGGGEDSEANMGAWTAVGANPGPVTSSKTGMTSASNMAPPKKGSTPTARDCQAASHLLKPPTPLQPQLVEAHPQSLPLLQAELAVAGGDSESRTQHLNPLLATILHCVQVGAQLRRHLILFPLPCSMFCVSRKEA